MKQFPPPSLAKSDHVVACYAPTHELHELAGVVRDRHFDVALGPDVLSEDIPPGRFIAAIVSDGVERPLQLCRKLHAICPTILVASDATLEMRRSAARFGVEAIVLRPVNRVELSDWLERFNSIHVQDPGSVAIVDDDALSSEFYALALTAGGMQVTNIGDPLQALAQLENLRPDLIVTDLHMPEMDGSELIRIIRQCTQFSSVPIICLSAETSAARQLETRSSGADDFIAKPVDIQKLVSIVRVRIERSRFTRSLAERDGLTGLLTHSRLKDRLALELRRCGRTSSQLSFAMLDIDHFKRINDNYGHPFGDIVIRGLARLLRSGLRQTDIVGRYGGEEFGVILLDTHLDQGRAVIDTLRQRFAEMPFESAGTPVTATFSAGLSSNSPEGCIDRLIAHADRALYRAKSSGRNCVAHAVL
jgi:diguanylate cyclase (GGDEF)-like protein